MQPFNPQRAPVFGKVGMACSSQPLAAAVGRDILKAGGNAADAAIAMAAMVNVTEPMMNGLGGDCMILAHWNSECLAVNGSGRSGSRLTIDNLRAAGFSAMPQAGAAAVTVPGALDAYLALHERFGTMELADLFEPAAAYADEGFAVGTKIAQVWEWGASKLERFSADPSPYLPGGAAPKPGDIFRQQDLARTWRSIGKNGRGAFYAGNVRDRILDVLHKAGGFLDSEDFDQTQAEWVEPLRGAYRGHTIVELPPNGQGVVALMALGILESYDLRLEAGRIEPRQAVAQHASLDGAGLAAPVMDHHAAIGVEDQIMLDAGQREVAVELDPLIVRRGARRKDLHHDDQAVAQAQAHVIEGHRFVVDIDLAKFSGSITTG